MGLGISIKELQSMGREEADSRIRERITEMYVAIGQPEQALSTLWQDVAAYQGGF